MPAALLTVGLHAGVVALLLRMVPETSVAALAPITISFDNVTPEPQVQQAPAPAHPHAERSVPSPSPFARPAIAASAKLPMPSAVVAQAETAVPNAAAMPDVAAAPHVPVATAASEITPVAQEARPPRMVSASAVRYVRQPAPQFPAQSRRLGESGEVVLKVLVDVEGHPQQVLVQRSSGYPRLDDAAVLAMKAALFKPYLEDGRALSVWVQTPIAFHLEQSS